MNLNSFKTLLKSTYKSLDTEEHIDIYFTRPIGLVLTLVCKKLGIKPNTITISSFFFGIAAGWMFYHTGFWYNVCGVLLMMMANFCDSADGQLARMTNQTSLTGRMLDGFASDVWFASVYVAICFRLMNTNIPGLQVHWGIGIWLLCSLAGFVAHARQARLADYYRGIHLFFLQGSSEFNSYESQKAIADKYRKEGNWKGVLFYANYAKYCKAQEHATPEFQRLRRALEERFGSLEYVPQSFRNEYRKKSLPLMKYANFLTHNWRAFTLFFACLINRPWIYPLFEVTVMMFVCIHMHKRHDRICRYFISKLAEKSNFNDGNRTAAFIFDYGATLDTRGEHWSKVIWRAYQTIGIPVSWEQFWEAYRDTERQLGQRRIIMPTDSFHTTLEKKISLQINYLNEHEFISKTNFQRKGETWKTELVELLYNETLAVTEESREVLNQLRGTEATRPMVLVSNFYGNINTVLEEFHLDTFFDCVIESAQVGIRKPDKRLWQMGIDAIQKINPALRPQAITVVGDSLEKDIQPAQALGCNTILVTNGIKYDIKIEK